MYRSLSTLAIAALAAGLLAAPARAQFVVSPGTMQVQEDWKLVVAQGAPFGGGPQIMTYMSSASDSKAPYAWFLINVRDAPNPFTPGGFMVQVWDNSDALLTSSTGTSTAQLSTANETITWTQRMAIDCRTLNTTWDIINVVSTTWGSNNASQLAVTYTGTTSFSAYDPNFSVAKSRVGWLAGNVTSMTLVAVRQYDKNGKLLLTTTLNAPVNLTAQ